MPRRRRRSKAELRARDLLERHAVEAPPVDVEAIAQAEGAFIRYEPLQETSGLLVRREDGKIIIGVNSLHHPNRQRFTIAHELGHMLLHADHPTMFVDGHMVHFRDDQKTDKFDPREIEANAFAAAVLMPETFVRRDLSPQIDALDEVAVRTIANHYQVSQQALTIRLMTLGLVVGFST